MLKIPGKCFFNILHIINYFRFPSPGLLSIVIPQEAVPGCPKGRLRTGDRGEGIFPNISELLIN
jgi:hypothetical protein